MFRQFFRQFRTHRLASQIRQVRTDLRPLTDQQVIDQYMQDELSKRQAATGTTKVYPINPLYRQVLQHVAVAPTEFYVEKMFLFQRICQQQADLIETSAERSQVMRLYEKQILSTANDLLKQLDQQEANQQVNSSVRRN